MLTQAVQSTPIHNSDIICIKLRFVVHEFNYLHIYSWKPRIRAMKVNGIGHSVVHAINFLSVDDKKPHFISVINLLLTNHWVLSVYQLSELFQQCYVFSPSSVVMEHFYLVLSSQFTNTYNKERISFYRTEKWKENGKRSK